MKKTIRANWILTLLGIVITLVGAAAVSFNWDDATEKNFYFSENKTSVESSYISIGGTKNLTSYQIKGNSSCKYSLYKRTRTNSTYNSIYTGEKYSNNNTVYNIYSVKFGSWADTKLKVNKTAGTSTSSEIVVAVEGI